MQNKQKGVVFVLLGAFFFALVMLFVKLAGPLPSLQKSLFRNIFALVFASVVILRNKVPLKIRREDLPLLLLRSLMGTIGIIFNFYAIDHLILSDATILNKLAPFFAILFGWLALGERIKFKQILLVLGAFAGALLVIKPSFQEGVSLPHLVAIGGGLVSGVAFTCLRVLGSRKVSAPIIVGFFSLFSTVAVLPFALHNFQSMQFQQLFYLVCAGVSAAGGQYSITKAYSYAPAKDISVFDYTQILFTSLFSILIFSEFPDTFSILGYLVIIIMAVFMVLFTRKVEIAAQ